MDKNEFNDYLGFGKIKLNKVKPCLEFKTYSKALSMEIVNVGYWNEKKEKLKEKFPIISDQDLCFFNGKEQEMMEMLEYKLRITKDELRRIIDDL